MRERPGGIAVLLTIGSIVFFSACGSIPHMPDTTEKAAQPATRSELPSSETPPVEPQPQPTVAPIEPVATVENKPLTITAVGDVNMGSAYPSEDHLPPDGGQALFAGVQDLLSGDVIFGNLEGPLVDEGTSTKCSSRHRCYAFRTPTDYVQHLKAAGFTVMSVANNHTMDFGPEGRQSTMATLDRVGIAHSGPVGDIARLNVRGRNVVVIAFTAGASANNLLEIDTAAAQVRVLKDEGNLVIVSFHGGTEGLAAAHVQDTAEFLGGEPRGHVIQFAHAVVDAGADVVLGHGPHLLRGLEVYRGRLIAYSLGNFCTYGSFSLLGPLGHAVVLSIEIDPHSGAFLKGRLKATAQEDRGVVKPDPAGRGIREIQELSAADFRFSSPQIDDDGAVRPGFGDGAGLLALPDAASRGRVRKLMLELADNGIPDDKLRRIFGDNRAELSPDVIEKFAHPIEALPYEKYRALFVQDELLKAGATFIREQEPILTAVQKKYNVNPEILVAIIAVETRFGLKRGSHRVFNALATVALANGHRRARWARNELEAFLKVHGENPLGIFGSYAGAVGLVQFLPSSIQRYGQDGDQDGRIDLDNWIDAIASAANYLKNAGWQQNGPLSAGSPNFRALFRYNPSESYVKIVGELGVLFGYPLPKTQPLTTTTTSQNEILPQSTSVR